MIDHETGKILLEKEDFYEWARLYESYVCDEYQMSREELKKYVVENPESLMPDNDSKFELIIKLMNGESNYSSFELTKEEVLYVGDSGVDMQTAINASVDAVGVAWGFRPRTELESFCPKGIIEKAAELLKFI